MERWVPFIFFSMQTIVHVYDTHYAAMVAFTEDALKSKAHRVNHFALTIETTTERHIYKLKSRNTIMNFSHDTKFIYNGTEWDKCSLLCIFSSVNPHL